MTVQHFNYEFRATRCFIVCNTVNI